MVVGVIDAENAGLSLLPVNSCEVKVSVLDPIYRISRKMLVFLMLSGGCPSSGRYLYKDYFSTVRMLSSTCMFRNGLLSA